MSATIARTRGSVLFASAGVKSLLATSASRSTTILRFYGPGGHLFNGCGTELECAPMRSIAALLLGLALLAGCSSAPSYKGGPSSDEPHAIVTLGERISLWKVDGKDAW